MRFHIVLSVLLTASLAYSQEPVVRVAVYEGGGVGASADKLIAAIESRGPRFRVSRISSTDISAGGLKDFDVLVQPGGSGSKQAKSIGPQGRETIRKFVDTGGGYLGVCAGAYLATNDYDWSLSLVDAKVLDRRHWNRGTGLVKVRLSPNAIHFFGRQNEEIEIYYGQGPLLARREWDDEDVPDYESLAIYDGEIAEKGAPRGVMIGTSAAIRCEFGKGRVFCFSAHPELTEGLSYLIPIAVDWLAQEDQQ